MVEIGTTQGMVHDPLQQGVGLATVLQGDRALDTLDRLGAERRAVARQEKEKKRAELEGAYDTMLKMNPERWMKHEKLVQDMQRSWIDEGASMMRKGENPWKSTTPAAVEFRKKQAEILGLAQTSKQMQALWDNNRQKIMADPEKYDAGMIKANAAFTDMDPREVIKQGLTPPPLMQKKPFLNLQDTVSKGMSEVNKTMNGQPIGDNDRWKISREFLSNPAIADDLNEAAASAIAQMTPADKDNIEKRARTLGKAPQEVLVYDFVNRYADKQKPFDFNEWINEGVTKVAVPYKEWKGAESFSKKVDSAEFNNVVRNRAQVMLADPEALREYERELPRDPTWNDGEYKQRASEHLARRLKGLVATQEEAGITAQGQGKKDLQDSRNLWLKNIESNDPAEHNEALGFLASAPGILPGMTVQNGEIVKSTAGYNELRLFLAGNLEYKDVKKTMQQAGIPVEENQVESRQTNTVITVPITTNTENALLRLHDHAFEDTKAPYKGPINNPKPDLNSLLGAPSAAPVTPPAKKNKF